MKKFYALLLFLSILGVSFAGNIQKTYYFDRPQIKTSGEFKFIQFRNTFITGQAGEPALPYQDVKLLLPPGESGLMMRVEYSGEVMLPGSYRIFPQQPSLPLSSDEKIPFDMKASVYSSKAVYPLKSEGRLSTYFQNGHAVAMGSFTPLRYIPSTGQVSYYSQVTVTITSGPTARSQAALANLNSSKYTLNIVDHLVQNPEKEKLYPVKENRDGAYQVLIITPALFESEYSALSTLYLERGMKSQVTSVETINSTMDGQDLQEKIRNYIIQEYQYNGIEYVLLGGDVEHVPYRGFYCHVQSSSVYESWDIPSDLYYSALDGTWDDNGNGVWGEIGEDDLLPDVAVARFPVSTVAQLQRLINKTVRYQDDPVTGELRKPLLAGENLYDNPLTWGSDYLDLLIGQKDDNGYTTTGIPESDNIQTMYDRDNTWSANDLLAAINQGHSFIHHSGHANQTYVMRFSINDITNANFSQVNGTDHNYTLVYTHGCDCGAFDDNDCIGEAMVCIDNFAVAGAFNSRYGWFNEGQTEGPSEHLHREFVNALYTTHEAHVGAAHMLSRIETSPWVNAPGQWEEGALRWCFYDCNIFGDPTLNVWTNEPMPLEVTYPQEIISGTNTISVSVNSNGQPAAGLMCSVLSGNQLLGNAVTDESGIAIIEILGGFTDISSADLVVSGYNCLATHYPMSITTGTTEVSNEPVSVFTSPNPFTNNIRISFANTLKDNASLEIYHSDGRMLFNQNINLNENHSSLNIDGSDWPSGLIYLRITTAKEVIIRKIIHINN